MLKEKINIVKAEIYQIEGNQYKFWLRFLKYWEEVIRRDDSLKEGNHFF